MQLHGVSTMIPLAQQSPASSGTNSNNGTNGTSGTGSTGSTSSTTSAANSAANSAQSTFISLLVTELQSQDPTQPMDPTQMVGQMFSMNQLEQLININQTLTNAFPAAAGTSPGGTGTAHAQLTTGAN